MSRNLIPVKLGNVFSVLETFINQQITKKERPMSLVKLVAVLLVSVLCLTGCATIVGKDVFPLTINSNPDGANISIVDEKGKKMLVKFEIQKKFLMMDFCVNLSIFF